MFCLGGLNPQKPTRGDGTGTIFILISIRLSDWVNWRNFALALAAWSSTAEFLLQLSAWLSVVAVHCLMSTTTACYET